MTAAVGLNLFALAALVGYVMWRAVPLTEAARLRNALLVEPSVPEDFAWSPPDYPPGFKVERCPPSEEFLRVVEQLGVRVGASDWDRSLVLARHLVENAGEKGALQADLAKSYRGIRDGYGYCADFVKVYLALAHAAEVPVRQWAFSFDGFGGHGHTFVEVYDRQRRCWRCLDVYGNFHFVDRKHGEPLSAMQLRTLLSTDPVAVEFVPNGPGRALFRYSEKALDYYRRGLAEWYMWWGNAVYSYYRHPAVAAVSRLSRWLAHLVANLLGLQPRIRILCTAENEAAVAAIFALRRHVMVLATLIGILLLTLLWQLLLHQTDA